MRATDDTEKNWYFYGVMLNWPKHRDSKQPLKSLKSFLRLQFNSDRTMNGTNGKTGQIAIIDSIYGTTRQIGPTLNCTVYNMYLVHVISVTVTMYVTM